MPSPHEFELQSTELYTALSKAYEERAFLGVSKLVYSVEPTMANVEIVSLWLRDAYVLQPRKNPRFGLLYADTLQMMARAHKSKDEAGYRGLMETGVVAFYSSQLIAWEDLARCADRTAGLLYRQNWAGEVGSIYSGYFRSLDGEKQQELLRTVRSIAANRDVSEPDRSACASGIGAMRRALEAGRCDSFDPLEDVPIPRLPHVDELAKEYRCDGAEFVTLIPDEEWRTRREEVRQAFHQRMLEAE